MIYTKALRIIKPHFLVPFMLFICLPEAKAVWLNKGEANYSETVKVLTDGNKNAITAGNFLCGLTTDTFSVAQHFCDTINTSVRNIFVTKYNSQGDALWLFSSLQDTSVFNASLIDFTLDASNNIYLTGWYDSSLYLANDTLTTIGARDLFILKLDADGNLLWSVSGFTGSDTSFIQPSSISIKADGNLLLAGIYQYDVNFNGKEAAQQYRSFFISTLNTSGTILNTAFATAGSANAKSAVVDIKHTSEDTTIIMALVKGDVSWSNSGTINSLYADTTNIAFFYTGNDTLVSRVHQIPLKTAQAFDTDTSLNIVIGGYFNENIEFADDTLTNSGNREAYLLKLSRTADYLWGKATTSYGTAGTADFRSIVCGADNFIYVGGQAGAGTTGMNLILDEDTFLNLPNKQAAFARFLDNGELDWLQFWGGYGEDFVTSVYADADSQVYVSGNFSDSISINNLYEINRNGFQNYYIATADLLPSFNPVLNVTGNKTVFCEGDSAELVATFNPLFTYQWYLNDSLLGNEFTQWAKINGSYKVLVNHTLYNYTKPTPGVAIKTNPLPNNTISITGDTLFCTGDSLLVYSNNTKKNIQYTWYENNVPLPDDTLRYVTHKSDEVFLHLLNTETGCENESRHFTTQLLEFPDTIIHVHDNLIFCTGDSVQLSTQYNADYSYVWFKNDDTVKFSTDTNYFVRSSGIYALEIINKDRCRSLTEDLYFTALASPQATLEISGDTVLCKGDSLTLVANASPGYSYKWYFEWIEPDSSNANINYASKTGTYFVEVFNSSGCSALSNELHIVQDSTKTPTFIVLGANTFCNGDSAILSMIFDEQYTFDWYRNNVFIKNETSGQYVVKTSGSYHAISHTKKGCSVKSHDETFTVRTSPDASLNIAQTDVCTGDSIWLFGKISSNTSYNWIFNGMGLPGETNAGIYAKNDGTYTFVARNTLNNCTDTGFATLNLVEYPSKTTFTGNPITCERDSVLLSLPGDGNYQYKWLYGNTLIPGETSNTLYIHDQGNYYAIITNQGLCTDTTNAFYLALNANPVPNINQNGAILSTASYKNMQWLKNNEVIANATAQTYLVTESGKYSVRVVHDNTCQSVAQEVEVCLPLPYFTNVENALTASNGSQYQWFFNGDTLPGATQKTLYAQLSGDYTVAVTGNDACTMKSTAMEICVPFPEISLEEGYILKATTGETYQWYLNNKIINGADTRVYVPEQPGVYKVFIVDYNGCAMMSEVYGHQVTGMNLAENLKIRLYPNPAKDIVHIELPEIMNAVRIEICDVSGKTVRNEIVQEKTIHSLNVSMLSEGMYLLRLVGKDDEAVFSTPFMVE